MLRAADVPADALKALQEANRALHKHDAALPRRTLEAALRAGEGVVLSAPVLADDNGSEHAADGEWVALAALARVAGLGELRIRAADRGERTEKQQASACNGWAKAAGERCGGRCLKTEGKQRAGAWAAPLDAVLAEYGS
jgi:hypothetical protein